MDLNLPPTTPELTDSAYQNASAPQAAPEQPVTEEVQAAPLIPVLRKPRIRVGRLLILVLGILTILGSLAYGGYRAYRYLTSQKQPSADTVPVSQFLPVSLYLNEVPFSFYSHTSWRSNLPTKDSPVLRIYPAGDPVTSNGKEVAALSIQVFDNPRGLTAKQLGAALDKQLGKDSGLVQEGSIGIGLQTSVVSRKLGGATVFVSLPNKKYMTIEQPLLDKPSDQDKSVEIYQVFTRTIRID